MIKNVVLEKLSANSHCIVFNEENSNFALFFSYGSLVAFRNREGQTFLRTNSWGNTTERLLKSLGAKEDRLQPNEFYSALTKSLFN